MCKCGWACVIVKLIRLHPNRVQLCPILQCRREASSASVQLWVAIAICRVSSFLSFLVIYLCSQGTTHETQSGLSHRSMKLVKSSILSRISKTSGLSYSGRHCPHEAHYVLKRQLLADVIFVQTFWGKSLCLVSFNCISSTCMDDRPNAISSDNVEFFFHSLNLIWNGPWSVSQNSAILSTGPFTFKYLKLL